MVFTGSWGWRAVCVVCFAILSGCASHGVDEKKLEMVVLMPAQGGLHFRPQDKAQWQVVTLPGKLRTAFQLDKQGHRQALRAHAQSSASLLRQRVNVPATRLERLRFEWQVDNLMPNADMAERDRGDSPVRLILAFEGDRSRFSTQNAMLSELSQALTGEPLPYATLMYVWSNHHAVDSVIVNPRTDRVRKWVVESGEAPLNQWRTYQRNVRADFEKAFGEAPGALVSVAIMTDADNTRSSTVAWYGDIHLD